MLSRVLESAPKSFVGVFQSNGSHSHSDRGPYFRPLHGDFGDDAVFESETLVFDKRDGFVAGKENAIRPHKPGISKRSAICNRHSVGIDKAGSWQTGDASHNKTPPARIRLGRVSAFLQSEQAAGLSYYPSNQFCRAFYRNLKTSNSTSFPISIRVASAPCEHRDARALLMAQSRPAPRNSFRRALAGDGFIVVARSFFQSREHSLRFNTFENPSRHNSDLLPGFFCRVRDFTNGSHASINRMGDFHSAANQ
jgi:hypothetical protein